VISLFASATLSLATTGAAEDAPPPPASIMNGENPGLAPISSAETILASQPADLVARLMKKKVIVLQEIREEGSLRGGLVSSYVLFEKPIERVYLLLSQSARQVEFRPELTSIETVELGPDGPIDEQRLKILFQRYVYRLEYRLSPKRRRIEWVLDKRFDNDFKDVLGYWELFEMEDGGTLGRSGTSIDVGPAIPAFLQDWVTRKNIPKAMKRVQRWVDSDGTYRP
jgi:hypothetical protein